MKRTGCSPMEFAVRSMKGFVYVAPVGSDLDKDWGFWIGKALEFNPKAKKSYCRPTN